MGILVDEKLKISWQHVLAIQKKNYYFLGCIKRSMSSRSREVIVPLYSTLVRPHWECCILLWAPQYRHKDINLLKTVQRSVMGKIAGLKHLSYEKRRRKLGSFNLEKRK